MFKRFLSFVAIAIVAATGANGQTVLPAMAPSHAHSIPAELVTLRKLRAGGNVIFFRHERTDHLTPDSQDFQVDQCAGQRNLNAAGVAAAAQSGEEIRVLKIPIGEVFASPMCRTQETARFMFRHYRLEPRLFSDWRIDKRSPETLDSDFRALVAASIKPNVNTVMVGHIVGGKAFGVSLHEGEAIVLTLNSQGTPIVVGTIDSARWGDLVGDYPDSK